MKEELVQNTSVILHDKDFEFGREIQSLVLKWKAYPY